MHYGVALDMGGGSAGSSSTAARRGSVMIGLGGGTAAASSHGLGVSGVAFIKRSAGALDESAAMGSQLQVRHHHAICPLVLVLSLIPGARG